jgi:phage tail-like protein
VDSNGTRYHLLYGLADWRRCSLLREDETDPLADPRVDSLADLLTDESSRNPHVPLEWDPERRALRLARQTPIFGRGRRARPLDVGLRRGAGRDRYGNWYWIDPTEQGIRFLPYGARQSVQWWTSTDLAARCTPGGAAASFTACQPLPPPALLLRGLAVTTRHYLVVGDVTERGLLVFDLHAGGMPLLVRWPEAVPFVPWDLAPTPQGGVLVLDRDNLTYWALDADFRLLADIDPTGASLFQPIDPSLPRRTEPGAVHPRGYPLGGGSPGGPLSPVSISAGPDDTVLILDTDLGGDGAARPYSIVYEYRGATLAAEYSLENAVEAADPTRPAERGSFSLVGHDLAYVGPDDRPSGSARGCACGSCCADSATWRAGRCQPPPEERRPSIHLLYVAERDGNQVIVFEMNRGVLALADRHDFLPLRRWGGKALVAVGSEVYYDFGDRWVPLDVYTECHYARRAVFATSSAFAADVPGGPLDGGDPGTVWHRLLLDAQVPAGTAVRVRARAADDPELLTQVVWSDQPEPYLRGAGRTGSAELPYYDPWADLRGRDEPFPERTGTWELLFQEIRGRYLQLELTLEGTGRSTPTLRALRAWYPRFSYSEQYLPAIYREEPVAASFIERWLANYEGFCTALEDKITHVGALFDARTAPPEALDWLACWFGVVLDPLWDETRRRFFIRHADRLYRRRGTVSGLTTAVRLYLDCTIDERLLDDRACDGWSHSDHVAGGGVRIVEHFMTRGVGGLAFGDPTDSGSGAGVLHPLTAADIAASAHRFTVLVPHTLAEEDRQMVERIVALEKPAHSQFELKPYWALFRVGEARTGIDTRLGESAHFVPWRLGRTYLPDGYLVPRYPFHVGDRVVPDRDRLGDLPPL